jgi:hypothetical protein
MRAMSETEHEHTFVWDGEELLPCACGADLGTIQAVLDAAADDARRVAGETHYTGCRVRNESETVELWLFNAPSRVLRELETIRPGVYAIHDAPRPETAVFALMDILRGDRSALRAEGIRVIGFGPTVDGYLRVLVMGDVPTAQARIDALFGSNVARVEYGEPPIALSALPPALA